MTWVRTNIPLDTIRAVNQSFSHPPMDKIVLRTKRERALAELELAMQSVDKALSLLGGRTRHKPKSWQAIFTARQYLESIESRLRVTEQLLLPAPRSRPEPVTEIDKEYDRERQEPDFRAIGEHIADAACHI